MGKHHTLGQARTGGHGRVAREQREPGCRGKAYEAGTGENDAFHGFQYSGKVVNFLSKMWRLSGWISTLRKTHKNLEGACPVTPSI